MPARRSITAQRPHAADLGTMAPRQGTHKSASASQRRLTGGDRVLRAVRGGQTREAPGGEDEKHPAVVMPSTEDESGRDFWGSFLKKCHENGVLEEGLTAQAVLVASYIDLFKAETRDIISQSPLETEHMYTQFPRSKVRLAEVEGDLTTAFNALRTFESYLTREGAAAAKTWCQRFDIDIEAVRATRQLRATFQQCFEDRPTPTPTRRRKRASAARVAESDELLEADSADGVLLDLLASSLTDQICVYAGHDSLGYYHIASGQKLPICPLSSTHLLTRKPEFAICYPKAAHKKHLEGDGSVCHHVCGLREDRALHCISQSGLTSSSDLRDRVIVRRLEGLGRLGTEGRRKFKARWRGDPDQQEGLFQEECRTLCEGAAVLWDEAESERTLCTAVYAPPAYHEPLKEAINREVAGIRQSLLDESALLGYPKCRSPIGVLLGSGLAVKDVILPGQGLPREAVHLQKNAIKGKTSHVVFKLWVRIDVRVGDLRPLDPEAATSRTAGVVPGRNWDPVLKTCAVLKRLMSDLREGTWRLASANHNAREDDVTVVIVAEDCVTARRAVMMVNHGRSLGIPVTVVNDTDVEKQLARFEIAMDQRVFDVFGKALRVKLDNYTRSEKFALSYEIAEGDGRRLVRVSAKSPPAAREVMEKLEHWMQPLVWTHSLTALWSMTSPYMMQCIMEKTGSAIYDSSTGLDFIIYGVSAEVRKEAKRALEEAVAGANTYIRGFGWSVVEPFCSDQLPPDMLYKIHRRIFDKKSKTTLKSARFDYKSGRIHVLCSRPSRKHNTTCLEQVINGILEEDNSPATFDLKASQLSLMPTCCVCYTADHQGKTPYVLEGCGHPYCLECFKGQVTTATQHGGLPLHCAGCDSPFTLADLRYVTAYPDRIRSLKRLVRLAISCFVAARNDDLRFCPAASCDGGIYRVTRDRDVIACGLCTCEVCASCLQALHPGLTCEEYERSFLTVFAWMEQQPSDRKRCPKCSTGIEKADGCNNVQCAFCKMCICWKCLDFFDSHDACYEHLDEMKHWE